MKIVHRLLGILIAFCLMWILFITSIQAVVYWNPGYFEKEYTKYQVLDDLPPMTMEDLLDVTDEMMDYLKGDRADLHVTTTMGGENREFFNDREIAHMEDVRDLFLGAIFLRRVCLVVAVACLALLFGLKLRSAACCPRPSAWAPGCSSASWRFWRPSYPQTSPNTSSFSTTSSLKMTCGFSIRKRTC